MNKNTSNRYADGLAKMETLKKILSTRWKNVLTTIACSKNNINRKHVQYNPRPKLRTLGNDANHWGIRKTVLLPKLRVTASINGLKCLQMTQIQPSRPRTPLLAVSSVLFSWISGCYSWEFLRHCTTVFLVWFSRNGFVSDWNSWKWCFLWWWPL